MSWKVATFNVNGVRARLPVVTAWLESFSPDVLCLQEIKCRDEDFPAGPFRDMGYTVHVRGQKSFNGVAILSREAPETVVRAFEDGGEDEEARMIAAKVRGIWVVNTYVPQGRDPQDDAFRYKLDYFARLKRWLAERFDGKDPLIWLGDINVAPSDADVFDPRRLEGHVGCHPAERRALGEVVADGLVDLFRKHHPDRKQFTFWDYRLPKSFQRDLGWRLDHILANEAAAKASLDCDVDTGPRGLPKPSDHTPVWAELDWDG